MIEKILKFFSLTSKTHDNETRRNVMINLAIAVESKKHPRNKSDYKVWYLEVGPGGKVNGIAVKTKKELIASLFESIRKTGKSNWRAFCQSSERSTPIEAFDFVSMNTHENTHFGSLPTLQEFQQTLDLLQANLELRSIAS